MGPRKKAKPNPKAETEVPLHAQENPAAEVPLPGEPEGSKEVDASDGKIHGNFQASNLLENPVAADERFNTPRSTKSWYGGAWPRVPKAGPVTQVAKESISAASGVASEIVASARTRTPQGPSIPLKSPSLYLSRSLGSSSRSLPLTATTTKLNITSNASSQHVNGTGPGKPPAESNKVLTDSKVAGIKTEAIGREREKTKDSTGEAQASENKSTPAADAKVDNQAVVKETLQENASSWLGWFSTMPNTHTPRSAEPQGPQENLPVAEAGSSQCLKPNSDNLGKEHGDIQSQRRNSDPNPKAVAAQGEQQFQPRSWLALWGSPVAPTGKAKAPTQNDRVFSLPDPPNEAENTTEARNVSPAVLETAPQDTPESSDPAKSSGWAFWLRNNSGVATTENDSMSEVGKLAVAGSPSQSKPEDARVDSVKGIRKAMDNRGKRERPKTLENGDETGISGASMTASSGNAAVGVMAPPKSRLTDLTGAKGQKSVSNLLLPSFRQTYRALESPSLLQRLGRLLIYTKTPEPKHVSLVWDPPRIKRALAVGIHGYFPAPLIRTVLGQPTGTSIKFAESAADAIRQWTKGHGYLCEIEKVALEGEGRIGERIDLLWKLMLNWIEDIRKADFILIACHSQGVPVAMMLVAKLISFGCVNSARIGVCAMAGVNLGPFADYKSRWISGSAGELFDFARPDSQVSKDYEAALDTALRFGVRTVFVGSIDDQLVSLESSTFGLVNHPYIYRAVFVDGRIHAPDFLTHLVGFALKLRNLGISDHGLVRELSSSLAGSLYGGEGHSRIYDDKAVYYLAVEHALETSSVGEIPLQVQRGTTINSQNPYILPFAMRGLLEEDFVRKELYDETTVLLKQFDDWKPSSKVLKDVKFRLEGVRSKL